jgi:hypothetical protein
MAAATTFKHLAHRGLVLIQPLFFLKKKKEQIIG